MDRFFDVRDGWRKDIQMNLIYIAAGENVYIRFVDFGSKAGMTIFCIASLKESQIRRTDAVRRWHFTGGTVCETFRDLVLL